ncbi:MAG: hypothetical protein P4L36_16480 [Holophaga sp.]|nr:hypothetical protein [Holophaga sp.]
MSAQPFTLRLLDHGARLMDGAGHLLAELKEPDTAGADALRELLPPRAPVQLLLGGALLQCAEVPALAPRERRDVARRLAPGQDGMLTAQALDADPLAEGGHVLWMAAHPRRELDRWLELLAQARARPVFAVPWQRALLAAGRPEEAGALYLTLEPGAAHLLFFRGRNLRFTRVFPPPPELDLREPGEAGIRALGQVVAEELSLLLQFLQQKHRGWTPTALFGVGLPEAAEPAMAALGRSLGLDFSPLGPDLAAFLLEGAARERRRKNGLDLIPQELRDARKRGLFRAVVWGAVAALVALGGATEGFLLHHERILLREAVKAEAAREQRRALAQSGEEAARLRFGLLRLRRAEERQKRAVEGLEQLGVQLLQAPRGLVLQKVEVAQVPGDEVENRFQVDGWARTRKALSLGFLVAYYRRLARFPGMKLAPLHNVRVQDQSELEPGITRFHLEGTAP